MQRATVAGGCLVLAAAGALAAGFPVSAPPAPGGTGAGGPGARATRTLPSGPASLRYEIETAPMVLHGCVVTPEGEPVAGAEVWLEMMVAGARERVVVGRGDAVGLFEIELRGAAAMSGAEFSAACPALCARAPGRALAREELWDQELFHERIAVSRRSPWDIELWRGATVSGRVVDGSGAPVAGATVESSLLEGTRTDARGHFEYGARGAGPEWFSARKEGEGTARLSGIPISATGNHELPDLVLRGDSLQARLLFASGVPLRNRTVNLDWVDTLEPGSAPAVDAPGLMHARAITDADGRFRARGLYPGQYAVRPADLVPDDLELRARTDDPATDLVLELSRLELLARNEHGTPLEWEHLEFWIWESRWGPALRAQRDGRGHGARAVLAKASALGKNYQWAAPDRVRPSSVLVPPDSWWYGRFTLPAGEVLEEIVHVGPVPGWRSVTVARRGGLNGSLRIVVQERGAPRSDQGRAYLFTPMGGFVDGCRLQEGAGMIPDLAPGSYELRIDAGSCDAAREGRGDCWEAPPVPVRVDAGQITDVALELRRVGHLGLRLWTADGIPAPYRPRCGPPSSSGVWLERAATGEPVVASRFTNWDPVAGFLSGVRPDVNPARPSFVHADLLPGTYTLHVALPGYVAARAPVTIRSRYEEVELRLEPVRRR